MRKWVNEKIRQSENNKMREWDEDKIRKCKRKMKKWESEINNQKVRDCKNKNMKKRENVKMKD